MALFPISIPQWGSMTLVEAIWLASGIMALVFAGVHLRPLFLDWSFAHNTGRPVLTAVAGGYLRREIIRLLQGAVIAGIGVYGAVEPQPTVLGHQIPAVLTPVGVVLTVALLALSLLVSVQSMWDWRTRHHVQQLASKGKNGDHERAVIP